MLEGAFCEDRFGVFDVDVAKVGIPVLVGDGGCGGEFTVGESDIDVAGGDGEFVKHPALRKGFMRGFGRGGVWRKGRRKFRKDEFGCLVDFVAEAAITVHDFYVKVDVDTWEWLASRKRYIYGLSLPPVLYETKPNRRASVPHSGMPSGKAVF